MTDPATTPDDAPDPDDALDPEDAKLVTLARSGRPRAVTVELPPEGAAVRDDTGRTYLAATVEKGPLALPALHLAVATALASGARGFEAAAVVTELDQPAGADVLEAAGVPKLIVARPDGTVVRS